MAGDCALFLREEVSTPSDQRLATQLILTLFSCAFRLMYDVFLHTHYECLTIEEDNLCSMPSMVGTIWALTQNTVLSMLTVRSTIVQEHQDRRLA